MGAVRITVRPSVQIFGLRGKSYESNDAVLIIFVFGILTLVEQISSRVQDFDFF